MARRPSSGLEDTMMVSDPRTTLASASRMGVDSGREADTALIRVMLTVLLLGGAVVGGWTVCDIPWLVVDEVGDAVLDERSWEGVGCADMVLVGIRELETECVVEYGGVSVMGVVKEADGSEDAVCVVGNDNVLVVVRGAVPVDVGEYCGVWRG
jgi:hypothetical protein